MKRKTMTMLLCLLTVLSVVGVGFASWIINDGDEEVKNGNIVVDTVSDERLELSVTNTALDINFTAPQGYNNEGKWLQSDTSIYENLTVTFSCTVTKKNGEEFSDHTDVKLELTFDEPDEFEKDAEGNATETKTAYGKAKEANCFALATENINDMNKKENGVYYSDLKLSGDKKSITFTVIVKYVWGTSFDSLNPFYFYGGKEKASTKCGEAVGEILATDATWGDHAEHYLRLLEAVKETAPSYSLTIQVEPAL